MWRVTVSNACVGSGMCIGLAARHFQLDSDDRSRPVHAEVEPDESVLDAALSCPMEAIHITDSETGDEVYGLCVVTPPASGPVATDRTSP